MGDIQAPSISVIIATKEGRHLQRCLKYLQQLPSIEQTEVLVVVDSSNETSHLRELKLSFPTFHFHLSSQGGVSNARNMGLRLSTGAYFLFLDDDCMLEASDFMERLKQVADDSSFLHGGSYALPKDSPYLSRVYHAVNYLWLCSGRLQRGQIHLLGGFVFGRSELKPFVYFPPELKWGGEEKEMLRHFEKHSKLAGKWHPDFTVTHLDNSNFTAFSRRAFRQGMAAGRYDLSGPIKLDFSNIAWDLFPGLILFFILSRCGIVAGRWEKFWSRTSMSVQKVPLPHRPGEKES